MPIFPPLAASVLDTVYSVLAAAKVRLNDSLPTLQPVGGQILGNGSPFSQQITNNAWRKMLEYLASLGFTALKQEVILYSLPAVATTDPAIPCWIDWFNFNDGANLYPAPVLPADLIIPLKLWERPSGQNAPFPAQPMELFMDGLPGRPKQIWNGMWEWRANAIYFPGTLQVVDFRLLYARYLGDFVDSGNEQWFERRVPVPRCQDAFSLYICAEIANTREDMDADVWTAKAESAARLLCNREVAMKQRGNIHRQSRSGRLESGRGYGW
jgi:hypothetical protein